MTNPFTLTKEQYQELYKEVLLFSKIGGVIADENNLWKMCYEEFVKELLPAIEKEDKLQVIDGVADSWVTLVQLHHYHMSKPTWELPKPQTTYLTDLYELTEMISCKLPWLVHNSLQQLLSVSEGLAKEYNFNLYKAIKEVNRSNMTKFPTATKIREYYGDVGGNLHLAAMECMELSNGKYKDVVAFWNPCTGSDLVVFRADFGKSKIVKHLAFYEEPNFEDCWV
jgi:hypothetical protein